MPKDHGEVVRDLIKHRKEVVFEADGADDRVYPSEEEWESIEYLLDMYELGAREF